MEQAPKPSTAVIPRAKSAGGGPAPFASPAPAGAKAVVMLSGEWRGGRMARKRQQPEAAIQRAVFQHLCARAAPNVFAFHPANGGYRKPAEAAIMKGLGVVAGVPDVIVIHAGRCYALEIKAPGSRATPKQLAAIAAMEAAGAFTCIAEGLDRALACLEAWGVILGRTQ
jgi:hypothetical protein